MTISKQTWIEEALALVTGVPTHCAGMTFVLGGQTYDAAEAAALAGELAAAGNAVIQAKAAHRAACIAEEKALATVGVRVEQLRVALGLAFSESLPTLADLKIPPKKPRRPLTGEERLVRDAKVKATRAARGTMSRKQRVLADNHDRRDGLGMVELRAVA